MAIKPATSIALSLTLAALLPAPASAEPGNYDDMQTTTGPGSLDTKLVKVGSYLCDPLRDGSLLPCGSDSPITQSLGGATFDVSGWSTTNDVRLVRFWAEWDSTYAGVFAPPGMGGFELTVCSDRDDDGSCTNTPGDTDNLASSKSNSGIVGNTACNKDKKDCPDPTDAEVFMCVEKDTTVAGALTGPGGGDYDMLTAFIGIWAGDDLILDTILVALTNSVINPMYPTLEGLDTLLVEPITQIIFDDPNDEGVFNDDYDYTTPAEPDDQANTGAGISLGRYNIYLQYMSFYADQDACFAANSVARAQSLQQESSSASSVQCPDPYGQGIIIACLVLIFTIEGRYVDWAQHTINRGQDVVDDVNCILTGQC